MRKEKAQHDQERQKLLTQSIELCRDITTLKSHHEELNQQLQTQLQDQAQCIEELSGSNQRDVMNSKNHISSPIQKLLTNYDTLDEDSKTNLFHMAILNNNKTLQSELFKLQQTKGNNWASMQAKLAKELIKLADTYKVPELTLDTKATKCRTNYFLWSSKLRPILAMFPQMSKVFEDINIKPYDNPGDMGNKALYLLVSAKINEYFQCMIKKSEGHGDKALAFIKTQCAHISAKDTHHYHHVFTTMRIKENESATNFFKRFTFAQTEAEAAGNIYTVEQLVSYALAGFTSTQNNYYETALQLY